MKEITCRPYEMSEDLARPVDVEEQTSSLMSLQKGLELFLIPPYSLACHDG